VRRKLKRPRRRVPWVVGMVVIGLVSATAFGGPNDWDIAVLDKILAGVAPGQKLVQVGDMFIKVSDLTA